MIKTFTKLTAIGVIAITACADPEMNINQDSSDKVSADKPAQAALSPGFNPFNKTTGAPIAEEKARQWIQNYKAANEGCEKSYVIKSGALKTITEDKKCVGISLCYARDPYNVTHILPIGIDEKGKQLQAKYICTERGNISWKTAQQWIANYTGATKSHFFGQNTFSRLWVNGVTDISISFARDDNDNPQLLLRPKTEISPNGKAAAQKVIEDASAACPPACPK